MAIQYFVQVKQLQYFLANSSHTEKINSVLHKKSNTQCLFIETGSLYQKWKHWRREQRMESTKNSSQQHCQLLYKNCLRQKL